MKTTKIIASLLAIVVFWTLIRPSEDELIKAPTTLGEYNLPPVAGAGQDFITYVGLQTKFMGYGMSSDNEIIKYEWDFDGDGMYDFQSTKTGITSHVYNSVGTYHAILKVYDAQGNIAIDAVKVVVRAGTGSQEYSPAVEEIESLQTPLIVVQGDGIVERYAVMINGGYETRFWNDVTFMYSTLRNDYNFSPAHIYLLNHDGINPDGINPDNMIDYSATLSNLDTVFNDLSVIIDSDDELFVWVTDHGRGYSGPKSQYYGYLDGFASVDPGDEQDYLESEFKLRSIYTGGNYRCNHGMNVWKVYYKYSSYYGAYMMYRNKYVTSFTNVTFEQDGTKSDTDILIERFYDLLKGDTNRNGVIDQGEVLDYDGDGDSPYNNITGVFDEDDWVGIYTYDDDWHSHIMVPAVDESNGIKASFFDDDDDGCIDIDIDYDETDFPNNLQSDGEDVDDAGLFDGIDLNGDGDMNDWVSIDEKICLSGDDMLDDELAVFLDRINANLISIFMEQCFSGGFIDDLSAPKRVISTATEEETVSWGNLFVGLFTSAFHRANQYGSPVDADYNQNGHISMREAFDYAAKNDYYDEIPQYDDNGDGVSQPYPIPQDGEGDLGTMAYLESFYGLALIPTTDTQSGNPGTTVTYTLQMTNTGNVIDTFDVSIVEHTWPITVPPTIGPLTAGDNDNLIATVSIPTDAEDGTADTATITITSQGDASKLITVTLTTITEASEVPTNDLYLPIIMKR